MTVTTDLACDGTFPPSPDSSGPPMCAPPAGNEGLGGGEEMVWAMLCAEQVHRKGRQAPSHSGQRGQDQWAVPREWEQPGWISRHWMAAEGWLCGVRVAPLLGASVTFHFPRVSREQKVGNCVLVSCSPCSHKSQEDKDGPHPCPGLCCVIDVST